MLIQQEIFSFTLDLLSPKVHDFNQVVAFENAVECAASIIKKYQCSNVLILSRLMPVIVNLEQRWDQLVYKEIPESIGDNPGYINAVHYLDRADLDLDDELISQCRTLSRLFTEAGESILMFLFDFSIGKKYQNAFYFHHYHHYHHYRHHYHH